MGVALCRLWRGGDSRCAGMESLHYSKPRRLEGLTICSFLLPPHINNMADYSIPRRGIPIQSLYLFNTTANILSGYLKVIWIYRTLFGNFSVDWVLLRPNSYGSTRKTGRYNQFVWSKYYSKKKKQKDPKMIKTSTLRGTTLDTYRTQSLTSRRLFTALCYRVVECRVPTTGLCPAVSRLASRSPVVSRPAVPRLLIKVQSKRRKELKYKQ